jgi:hypothetical protein
MSRLCRRRGALVRTRFGIALDSDPPFSVRLLRHNVDAGCLRGRVCDRTNLPFAACQPSNNSALNIAFPEPRTITAGVRIRASNGLCPIRIGLKRSGLLIARSQSARPLRLSALRAFRKLIASYRVLFSQLQGDGSGNLSRREVTKSGNTIIAQCAPTKSLESTDQIESAVHRVKHISQGVRPNPSTQWILQAHCNRNFVHSYRQLIQRLLRAVEFVGVDAPPIRLRA